MNLEKIKIKIKLLNRDDNLKGVAQIDFGDFQCKGFSIRVSKFGSGDLWVSPPTYQDSEDNWKKTFWLKSKSEWRLLKNKVIEAYEEKEFEKEAKQI